MKEQKGYSLILLIIAMAIIAFVGTQMLRTKSTSIMTDDDKSGFEQQIETIQQAEDLKETLEEKSQTSMGE